MSNDSDMGNLRELFLQKGKILTLKLSEISHEFPITWSERVNVTVANVHDTPGPLLGPGPGKIGQWVQFLSLS